MTAPARKPRHADPVRGEEELSHALSQLDQEVEAYVHRFFASVDDTLTDPIRSAFDRALTTHRRLLAEAGLEEGAEPPPSEGDEQGSGEEGSPTPPPDPMSRGRRVRRYREGVRSQVLEPLKTDLEMLEIGRTVAGRWEGFLNGLPALADALPQEVTRTEPPDLYGPREGDSAVTAFRKGGIRVSRAALGAVSGLGRGIARLFRRPIPPPPPRVQHVPLRALSKDAFLGRCSQALAGLGGQLQQHYGRPVTLLETAVAQWSGGWFPAERETRMAEGQIGARFLEELLHAAALVPGDSRKPAGGFEEGEEEGGEEAADEPGTDGSPGTGARLHALSGELGRGLAPGAALASPSHVRERIRAALEAERPLRAEDIRVSGSFQRNRSGAKDRSRAERALAKRTQRDRFWASWHQYATNRIQLAVLLLLLKEAFEKAEDQILGGIVDGALRPLLASWQGVQEELGRLTREADRLFSSAGPGTRPDALAAGLEDILGRAEGSLSTGLAENPALPAAVATVHQVADEVAGRLSDTLRVLPDSITVSFLQEEEDRVEPKRETRHLPFRDIVLRTVDVLRLESIRNSPEPLLRFFDSSSAECKEIPSIASFNLTAARDELVGAPETPAARRIEDARTLTQAGLAQTSRSLDALLENLAATWQEFSGEAHDLLEQSYREIHALAVAERAVQEQILGLRSRFASWLRQWGEAGRSVSGRVGRRARSALRRGRVRSARLIHLGRSAVGVAPSQEGEAERVVEALAGIPGLLEKLPLVYRRLFSLHPVTDPNLLVGREAELAWAGRRLDIWRTGFGAPLVMPGPVGGGGTSFLNVLATRRLEGFRLHRLDLGDRVRTSGALAEVIATAMGMEIPDQPWTLAGLEKAIKDTSDPASPRAFLLEHAEHLVMRTPGGTDLLTDFLSFQARTAREVFWLSTISGATWKFVVKSNGLAANLVSQSQISSPSPEEIQEIIMSRHRRSGLPVEFTQPSDVNPLLKRKLRLARGEKAKQAILRQEYFDRLYRIAEGSILMAILLWLRSADFASREGWLRVTPPRPIRIAFLDGLDLPIDFALKAFLEHGSLTLEEYATIFPTSRKEAFQVFETLRSRALLEPLGARGAIARMGDTVVEGERYRVPGILSQVIATRLKNRNILH